MNRLRTLCMAVLLTFSMTVLSHAAEEAEGSIGVQLKIVEGKIVVVEPIKDSPAEKAGILAGDTILKLNDYQIKAESEPEDLQNLVREVIKLKPGSKAKVLVNREGKEKTIEVTVGKRGEVIKDPEKK